MISRICYWVDSTLMIRKLLCCWNLSGNHFVWPMETIGCSLNMEPTYRNVCLTTCTWMKGPVFANQQSWCLTYKLPGDRKPSLSLRTVLHQSLAEQILIWPASCWKVNVTTNVGHPFWPDFSLQPSQRGGIPRRMILYMTNSWQQSPENVWSWPWKAPTACSWFASASRGTHLLWQKLVTIPEVSWDLEWYIHIFRHFLKWWYPGYP